MTIAHRLSTAEAADHVLRVRRRPARRGGHARRAGGRGRRVRPAARELARQRGRARVIDRPAADWHPEPDLVDFASPSARPALERLGEATWKEALDWLYGVALVRPMPVDTYPDARERYFAPSGGGPRRRRPSRPRAPTSSPSSASASRRTRTTPSTSARSATSRRRRCRPRSSARCWPVAAPGRRRVARRADRRVRGGGGHVVAPRALRHRPRGLGHPHLGRRDGEPDGDDRRARRAPRGPARPGGRRRGARPSRASACT